VADSSPRLLVYPLEIEPRHWRGWRFHLEAYPTRRPELREPSSIFHRQEEWRGTRR